MQRAIMAALLEIGDSAVEPLIEALSDDHEVVQTVAAEMLGELADARAEEPLIEMLSQADLGCQTNEAICSDLRHQRSEKWDILER